MILKTLCGLLHRLCNWSISNREDPDKLTVRTFTADSCFLLIGLLDVPLLSPALWTQSIQKRPAATVSRMSAHSMRNTVDFKGQELISAQKASRFVTRLKKKCCLCSVGSQRWTEKSAWKTFTGSVQTVGGATWKVRRFILWGHWTSDFHDSYRHVSLWTNVLRATQLKIKIWSPVSMKFSHLLGAAVTLSCRWNQSFVSVKLQGRSTNNTSHSDVWRYYTADNEISQQPFFSLCCTKIL